MRIHHRVLILSIAVLLACTTDEAPSLPESLPRSDTPSAPVPDLEPPDSTTLPESLPRSDAPSAPAPDLEPPDSTRGSWTWREEFRIGGIDGPPEQMFGGSIVTVARSPAGHLFVLDEQAESITVFDASGAHLHSFAGPGQGPGELNSPAAMAFDSLGRLWVANGFNKRYTLFDSTGATLRTVTRPFSVEARIQHNLLFDGISHFIDETGRDGRIHFFRVDTTGAVLDSFPPLVRPQRFSGNVSSLSTPRPYDRTVLNYLPRLIWTLAPDGTLWSADNSALRLLHRSLSGDTLDMIVATHRDSLVIDGTTQQRARAEFRRLGLDDSQYRLVRPVLQAIHALPDGHLLLQIETEPGVDSNVLDVVDPLGHYIGTLRLPLRLSSRGIPAIFGDTIVAIMSDSLDTPYLVRLVLERPSAP